ncbi:hypothetical protein NDU88_001424 [Pleurodeles waltl]|uniref:Uncharacterized protein n=1 Tax=Pleurodeles waltl TaxID=8319 RepID=A0AAV7WKG7_PLEWA|nr:hypothetical protein NDU88_001424 [Pleurodeles waltl]
MPPSRRTAAASSTRLSLPPDAAAPPPHAAGTALGSQPQPLPGFSSYPVTPLFQRGRVRGGSPVRHQLSRGSPPRPPFCFRGRDGRGSTTGAAFARCFPPEIPRVGKTTSSAIADCFIEVSEDTVGVNEDCADSESAGGDRNNDLFDDTVDDYFIGDSRP